MTSAPHAANARSFLMRVLSLIRSSVVTARLASARLQSVMELSPTCEKGVNKAGRRALAATDSGARARAGAGDRGRRLMHGLRREPVAEAKMRVDEARAGRDSPQLLAQPAHVYVHGAVGLPVGAAP